MIHIINNSGDKDTTIKKVKENLWEFSFLSYINSDSGILEDNETLFMDYNVYLEKKGIKDIISGLKKLIKEKYKEEKEIEIEWKENLPEVKILARYGCYDKKDKDYRLTFYARNKYLKNFHYTRYHMEMMDEGEPDPKEHGKSGLGIVTTEENLKKYINDLEKEIEEPLTDWKEFNSNNKTPHII